ASTTAAAEAAGDSDLTPTRKWLLTVSVMVVAVMQVLDTSVTNVALPHMQGSLSASVEEVAWVITSYLAANAIVIPATGWLTAYFGRRKFFLVCTVLFTASSFLSGIAPSLEILVLLRVSAFLTDAKHLKKPGRIDVPGLVLMIVGFGALQLTLDWGEREDWFDSQLIVFLAMLAVFALVAFVWRELTTPDPIMDFTV